MTILEVGVPKLTKFKLKMFLLLSRYGTTIKIFGTMFVERKVSYSECKQKMTSLMGQDSWAKMTSFGGKLTKDEELNYRFEVSLMLVSNVWIVLT